MGTINAVVVCDDIRREITGKDILIGVYAGNIVVPQFPFKIRLAFWVEYEAERAGEHIIKLRLTYSGRTPAEVTINAQIPAPGMAAMPIAGLEVNGDAPGELSIDCLTDEEWQPVKKIAVIKGAVVGITGPQSATAPPSVRMN